MKYADRELNVLGGTHGADTWFRAGLRFIRATGMYDNFTVAGGQNVTAWVTKKRSDVLVAAVGVLKAAEREPRARSLRIRHHYAWN